MRTAGAIRAGAGLVAACAVGLLTPACVTTPTSPAPLEAPRVFPEPPAPALARFEGSHPDPRAPAPDVPFSTRLAEVVFGVAPVAADAEPLLVRPFGVAVDATSLLVADPDGARVVRLPLDGGPAEQLSCADHAFRAPMAVLPLPDGALLVADAGAALLVRIERDGRCTKLGAGLFERPTGLALLGARLFVVDPPRHAVIELDPAGRELARFGARGEGPAELNFPTGIAAAPDGTLLVVDALNFRLSRFRPDGTFLAAFGAPGDGGGSFGRPKCVAVDAAGRLYVSDAQHDVVLAFEANGVFLAAIGSGGALPGSLAMPAGVAIRDNTLYVADSLAHRVQRYSLEGKDP